MNFERKNFFCIFLDPTCFTPLPFTSSDVIWSLKKNGTLYPTTYIENVVVSNYPCFVQGIIGERSAISLSANLQEYFTMAYLYDFRYISFSVSAWIYLNSSQNEMTIFAQCGTNIASKCLSLGITNMIMTFGFFHADTNGSTTLQINYWHHVAFVYNYTSQTQIVYLDGVEDGRGTSMVYLGDPYNITIGRESESTGRYFDGLIDRISILNRAMTADEVLEEATLSAYYAFDNSITKDSGPNEIDGYGYNVNETSSGGILFTSMPNASYFEAKSFLLLGNSQYEYSFSFWMNPARTHTSGSIIHISSENGWCLCVLGFSADGSIIAQNLYSESVTITASPPPTDVWTHITLTHSDDGFELFQNGTIFGEGGPLENTLNESPVALTLGYSDSQTNCSYGVIVPDYYSGLIAQFRIYSRNLKPAEIQTIMQSLPN